MAVELILQKEKWIPFSVYKQPRVKNNCLIRVLEFIFDTVNHEAKNIILCGDLNINMMKENNCLAPLFGALGVQNLVKDSTCFKGNTPTLLDLLVTNVPKRIQGVTCMDSELSDCHSMVLWATKLKVSVKRDRMVTYRSYKNFNELDYLYQLSTAPFHVAEIFESVDDSYWFFNKLLTDIVDEHAPVKCRKIKSKHVLYMNDELRKSINVRNMLKRKYKITLLEDGEIINDVRCIGNIFNDYYVNATQKIGQQDHITDDVSLDDVINLYKDKECITRIQSGMKHGNHFSFQLISNDDVYKKMMNINCKKSTGYDLVPAKLVKLGACQLSTPVTYLINKSIKSSVFPKFLKYAEVTPIFKKNSKLGKTNYRPVSVLPCLSKLFEAVLVQQLSLYFDDIFSPYISGFRKKHSCQDVLLHYTENCKKALDNKMVYGSLLTDLSRAFDSLPHGLLIAKLHAYGVCKTSCMLILNYLSERYQRVKLGNVRSDWLELTKGCPQGSLFGPLAYNIFSNDLILLIQDMCDTYNYADDNSIGCGGSSENEFINKLNFVSSIMLKWFKSNYLQANPEKFQFIIYGNICDSYVLSVGDNVSLKSETSVKLLGVTIDSKLSFSQHINDLCNKAGRQINALSRLSKILNLEVKYKLFETFILSHFNFCPVIWHYCCLADIRKIEYVQKRALRMIYNDFVSSYGDLRLKGNISLMYVQRLRKVAIEMFKCYHGVGPMYIEKYISKSQHKYSMRNLESVELPSFNTVKYGSNCFSYQGSYMWNNLPSYIKKANDIEKFKSLIKEWRGPQCTCSNCKLCSLQQM